MKKNTATIQSLFTNQHQPVNELFFTSNGAAFFKESDAATTAANLKAAGKSDEIVKVTRDEAFAEDTAGGEEVVLDPPISAEEQLANAQAAYDKAMASGDVTDITNTKKALSTAKARVTREANKTK